MMKGNACFLYLLYFLPTFIYVSKGQLILQQRSANYLSRNNQQHIKPELGDAPLVRLFLCNLVKELMAHC